MIYIKSKKWISIITFVMCIFALILSVYFSIFFNGKHYEYLTNVSLAIFGSSFIGLVIGLIEYFNEKRRSLENYYLSALIVVNEKFKKAKYFHFKDPVEEIKKAFMDEFESLVPAIFNQNKVEKKNPIVNLDEYTEQLSDVMRSFIIISETSLHELNSCCGNLDFIFGNRKFRKWIYTDIHNRITDLRNDAILKAFHFKQYEETADGNKPMMLKYIEELNENWFDVKKSDNYTAVFAKAYNELNDKLEQLRCKIYNQKHTSVEPKPLFYQYRSKGEVLE